MVEFYTGNSPNPHAAGIMENLSRVFKVRVDDYVSLKVAKVSRDPFRTLIVTILSQSSTDKGAMKAFEQLDAEIGVSAEKIAKAPLARIRRAIAVGGLQEQKARALKQIGSIILKQYGGELGRILNKPLREARDLLMKLPRVGPKTADVLLVTVAGRPTVPVDTHVNRVSKRLGLAPLKGGYEDVRSSLQSLYPQEMYHSVHLLLIAHGRTYCTAKRPRCPDCPVNHYCPYPNKTRPSPEKVEES